MSINVQVVCCNPFALPNHNKTRGLLPPSKKVAENHPWITTDHLVCVACRKNLTAQYNKDKMVLVSEDSDEREDSNDPIYTPRPCTSRTRGFPPPQIPPVPETLVYHRLVVPEGMRSIYWKHFGFPADDKGEIVSRTLVVCTICMCTRSYTGNTTNLRMHLRKSHPEAIKSLELNPPPPPTKASISKKQKLGLLYSLDVSGVLDTRPVKRTSKNVEVSVVNTEGKRDTDQIDTITNNLFANTQGNKGRCSKNIKFNSSIDTLKFISSELLTPEFIDSPNFKEFIYKIQPSLTLPTSKQIKNELIPLKYDEMRNIILCEISSVGEISISIEEWVGIDGQAFVTISANYLQNDNLVSRILTTLMLSDVNENLINETFSNWGLLQDHVVAIVVATQQSSVLDAVQQWATPIPCFQYTIQQAVNACFKLPNVEVVLWKCRTIASKYSNGNSGLSSIQIDYPKIWTSTYDLMKEIHDKRAEIDVITNSDEVKLTFFDWEIIEILVETLSPFTVTMQTIQEENPGLSSIIKPLFWQLITNYLEIKNNETDFPYTLKSLLKSKLLNAYNNQTNNLMLQTATTLDPRFKQVSFSTDDERTIIEQNIKAMLSQFENLPSPIPTPSKKVTGMEMLLGGGKKDLPVQDRADLELSTYTGENPVAFDQSPLQWWRVAELKYPTLIRLARTFMCVPACASVTCKLAREQRERFERQRANLSAGMVDKMIFLNGNLP